MSAFPTILAVIDGSEAANAALGASIALARRFEAHLDLLAVSAMSAPLIASEAQSSLVLQTALDAAQAAAEDAMAKAVAAVAAAGIEHEAALAAPPLAAIEEAVALRALCADLVVTPRLGPGADGARRAIDGALFHAPAPLLLWPPDLAPSAAETLGARPTIGWDGRLQAARAARLALPLIRGAAETTVVMVAPPPEDDAAPDPGAPFAAWLARHGISPTLRRIEGEDAGDALHQDALARGADLIVMGGYGHSQLREAIFGGATESLLRASSLPLFMAH